MQCPVCGSPVEGAGLRAVCNQCGWGSAPEPESGEAAGSSPAGEAPRLPVLRMALFWGLTLLVLFGPYLLIVYGVPLGLAHLSEGQLDLTPERLSELILPQYWAVLAVYLAIALLITPRYDTENLGAFGSPYLDNPFSHEDDYNRVMWRLGRLLLPGKIVWMTLRDTLRLIRGR